MKRLLNSHTRGQSMVLMVFLTVAIFGVLAFSLDMGYTYYNRRWAQNAADAGALAAARKYCLAPDHATGVENATNAAIDYVENRNLAFGVNSQTVTDIAFSPDRGLVKDEVQVDVAINHPNFVANFFGRDSTTVPATAAARCFAPGAAYGLIPIAWKCHRIFNEYGEDVCDMTFLSEDMECEYPEDYMYIFIESDNEFFWCDELGAPPELPGGVSVTILTCGANLEIVNTAQPVSAWAWVDLDGSTGGSCNTDDLRGWVEDGFEDTVLTHYWLPSCSGQHTAIFGSVAALDDGLIPIFDMICESNDARNDCDGDPLPDLWHDDIDTDLPLIPASKYTFHIIAFGKLKISCVDSQGIQCNQSTHARQALVNMNGVGTLQNIETLEGCFLKGFMPGVSGKPIDGVYAGLWSLYLTR